MAPSSMGEDLSLSSLGARFESVWGHVNMEYPIVTGEEFPYGVCCTNCGREILADQPYATKLESLAGGTPVTVVYCVYC